MQRLTWCSCITTTFDGVKTPLQVPSNFDHTQIILAYVHNECRLRTILRSSAIRCPRHSVRLPQALQTSTFCTRTSCPRLPPLVPSSAPRILESISPKAQERLAAYLAKFKARSQIPKWDISTTHGNVCSITVNISWDDFCTQDGSIRQAARGAIKSMHPLFALYFEMVRIHVSGKDDGWSPSHNTLRDRGRVDENMQRLLRDVVARMIDQQRDVGDVSLESAQDLSEVRPDPHVKTRRICISCMGPTKRTRYYAGYCSEWRTTPLPQHWQRLI
jgi:hypothetical protein